MRRLRPDRDRPEARHRFTSSIRYYDKNDRLIGTVFAPVRRPPDEYTFAGIVFNGPAVARVRITLGNAAIGAGVRDLSSGTKDVAVVDDFIYGEPRAIQ